jgi:hypothetical protein
MHGTINVKSPNNTSKGQVGFISEFKWLTEIYFNKRDHCTSNQKVAGLIPDCVIGIFIDVILLIALWVWGGLGF